MVLDYKSNHNKNSERSRNESLSVLTLTFLSMQKECARIAITREVGLSLRTSVHTLIVLTMLMVCAKIVILVLITEREELSKDRIDAVLTRNLTKLYNNLRSLKV